LPLYFFGKREILFEKGLLEEESNVFGENVSFGCT
jgi:hypothetical protein